MSWSSGGLQPLTFATFLYAYLIVIACAVFSASRVQRAPRLLVSAIAIAGCFIAPSLVSLRQDRLVVTFTLGLDVACSAYSYAADWRRDRTHRFWDCVFFVIVDPCLVFVDRARARNCPDDQTLKSLGKNVARVGLGVFALWMRIYVLVSGAQLLRPVNASRPALATIVAALIAFLSHYAAQSGLASVQIGFLRSLGYTASERFMYPLCATSPMEFWRRWNVYFNSWLKRYIFLPLALTVARRKRSWSSVVPKVIAAVATFVYVGMLHDIVGSGGRTIMAHATLWFACQAMLLIVWLSTRLVLVKHVGMRWETSAADLASALCFWTLFVLTIVGQQAMAAGRP